MSDPAPRYKLGEELTHAELRQAHIRIIGGAPSLVEKPSKTAHRLALQYPVRFAFEIDRCRGNAFDEGEFP